jgi:cytochrome P450
MTTDRLQLPPGPPPNRTPWGLYSYLRAFLRDPAGFVGRRFAEYGDMYYAPLGPTRLYVTRHPDHIRDALLDKGASFKKTETGNAARHLRRFLGNGLLLSNGELWRKQRRMINPSLHKKRIEAYAEIMLGHTRGLLERWRPGETVDVSAAMMQLTLGIVTQSLFDYGVEGRAGAVMEVMETFRAIADKPSILPAWLPLPNELRTRRALALVDGIIYDMIDERRALGEEALAQRPDLLSALILATDDEAAPGDERRMTRQLLRDELLTMFLAGHETTSHALSWTFYLLSQHPEAEARLAAELDEVLAGRPPTLADLPRLAYLDRVLSEAMRIYPPAPVISRTAIEDTEIGGYTLPAGAELIIWLYWTHRDPRWFPEPERFDPDRFAPEAPPLPRGAYLPFGGGTRICIGKEFALMEARLVLATVAQRFRLRLEPGQDLTPRFAVTLSPRNGLRMRPEPRGRATA